MNRIAYAAIIAMCWALPAWAFDVRATVDRTNIGAGESLNLTVTVDGGEADVDVSEITDFKAVSRGTATSMQIVNGHVSRETIYTFTLIPLRTGQLRIPALTVRQKGDEQRTMPIDIRVSQEEPVPEDRRDVFVRADVSEKEPYIGQQIRYTFILYNSQELRSATLTQTPSFNGFASEQIGQERKYPTILGGRQYEATELDYLLTPLKVGEQTIEPMVLDCGVIIRERRRGRFSTNPFLDDPFFGSARVEQRILRTEPLAVQVRPLPEYQGRAEYTGLVGDFRMEAALIRQDQAKGADSGGMTEKRQLTMKEGDSVTLQIVLSGQGNIKDAILPEIHVPEGMKVYKSEPEEKIEVDEKGSKGRKVFSAALVPVKPGEYELPPVELAVFDVSRGSYQTLSSGSFRITVAPSENKQPPVEVFGRSGEGEAPKLNRKKVAFTGRDILPLKEDLDALKSSKPIPLWMFVLMLASPAGICLAFGMFMRRRAREEKPSEIMARRSRDALKAAQDAESDEAFLGSLTRALVSAIFAAAGTKGESLTYAEAGELLARRGVNAEIAARAAQLLQKIDSARYGGIMADRTARENMREDVRALIRSLI